jgi:hypothetical protein
MPKLNRNPATAQSVLYCGGAPPLFRPNRTPGQSLEFVAVQPFNGSKIPILTLDKIHLTGRYYQKAL